MNEQSIRLKGNESFNIREGWLCKGINAIRNNAAIFTLANAMDVLGVGSKMVKSIRFWLQATGLTQELRGAGKRQQILTSGFGDIIVENDPYFEDIFTLWLLHHKIVSNRKMCIVWNLFFNHCDAFDFTKNDLVKLISHEIDKTIPRAAYSQSLLADDCASLLKMYLQEEDTSNDPEENLGSPLADLGLLQRSERIRLGYRKAQPVADKLDKLAIMYVILLTLEKGKNSISVDDLLEKPDSVGRAFNIGRPMLYDYLDLLRSMGCLSLNRTAGLDMIYVDNDLTPQGILQQYYQ